LGPSLCAFGDDIQPSNNQLCNHETGLQACTNKTSSLKSAKAFGFPYMPSHSKEVQDEVSSCFLAALLCLTSLAFACPNPIHNDVVRQDISSLETLGTQYEIAGGDIEDASRKQAIANQQGDVLGLTCARGHFALYRIALSGLKDALFRSVAKLNEGIKSALELPCPADDAGG
jgi:hypothetical protein